MTDHPIFKEGTRVLIYGDHPWHGQTGTLERKETWLGKPMWRVKLDNGNAAGAAEHQLRPLL